MKEEKLTGRSRCSRPISWLLLVLCLSALVSDSPIFGLSRAQSNEAIKAMRSMTVEQVRRLLESGKIESINKGNLGKSKGQSLHPLIEEMSQADRIQTACSAFGQKVIYGPDDRMDYGVASNRNPSIAPILNASVALFPKEKTAQAAPGQVRLITQTLGEKEKLCAGEPFHSQETGAFCSGTLIAPDVVLTAGHCIREIYSVARFSLLEVAFVFGFYARNAADRGATLVPADRVFLGKEVIEGVRDPISLEDWCVVQLNRPVPQSIATPVTGWRKSTVIKGHQVFVVGYPSGLPLKYAPNSTVHEGGSDIFFIANLDTFGGNSGAGVYEAQTNELVGILARGQTDYVESKDKQCSIAACCPSVGGAPNCKGEQVTRITVPALIGTMLGL
jgi:V8-like Glu-specific endopeptidase